MRAPLRTTLRAAMLAPLLAPLIFLWMVAGAAGARASDPPLRLPLSACIQRAEEVSTELRSRRLGLEDRRSTARRNLRDFLPHVEGGYTQSDTVVTGATDTRIRRVSVTVRQPVFRGGTAVLAGKLAQTRLDLQSFEYERARQDLHSTVWDLYYGLALARERVRLQEDLSRVAAVELSLAEKERTLGFITELDLLDTRIETQLVQSTLADLTLQERSSLFELAHLMRFGPSVTLRLTETIDSHYQGIDLVPETGLWADLAVQGNPDVRVKEMALQIQRAEYSGGGLTLLPQVEIETTFSVSGSAWPLQTPGLSARVILSFPTPFVASQATLDLGTRGADERSIGLSATGWIGEDIGSLSDRNRAAKHIEAGVIEHQAFLEAVRFLVSHAVEEQRVMSQAVHLQRSRVAVLQQRLDILESKLRLGELKRIELMRARIELVEQETQLLTSVLRLTRQEREIEKAIGAFPGTLPSINHRLAEGGSR